MTMGPAPVSPSFLSRSPGSLTPAPGVLFQHAAVPAAASARGAHGEWAHATAAASQALSARRAPGAAGATCTVSADPPASPDPGLLSFLLQTETRAQS